MFENINSHSFLLIQLCVELELNIVIKNKNCFEEQFNEQIHKQKEYK